MKAPHVAKRETFLGRWLPAVFYTVNFALWMITGAVFAAWDLLYLGLLPLPALAAYLWRTRRPV